MDLKKVIRTVPDFPKKGILFYDITSLFMDPDAFQHVLRQMKKLYQQTPLDGIIAIESRGFLLGAPFALERGLPLVLARKSGKLPRETCSESYNLEYGEATLEIHKSDLVPGKKWLIVDDLIATGGTLEAVAKLIESRGGYVEGIFSIIGLDFLGYRERLGKYDLHTLIEYNTENVE